MSFARPFAYNPGTLISGTEQIGNLSVGTPTSGFTNNPQYWNGPDEELGYVIAQSVSGNTQPTPLSGITASVGFFRSDDLTEGSFIEISEVIADQSFATGNDAKTWLNNNGYWTSYEATPDPTPTVTLTPTVTTTPTPTITPTIISCLDIATNSGGGLNGWSTTAFDIAPNPAIGTTYPVGSQILFQNGEIRTMVQVDDYSPSYMDIFYDSPISSTTLFPIKICYPSIPMSTPTPTSTSTPTNTPTPSSTPKPVTGYSFNLIAVPYNFPASGNSIMNGPGGATSGSTDINALATLGSGFYLNSFDNDGIDRTSYYSGFTGQSVTITFNQTGNTAIYSGDTNSFKQWIQSPQGSGFVFGTNIGIPPSGTPSGTAVLIQSATTQYTIGFPVYVSLVVN